MADLAVLNVRVEAREAIRQADNLSRSLKSTGVAGEQATQSHKRTEAELRRLQLAEMSARQEAERMAAAQTAGAKASQFAAAAMRVATIAATAYAATRVVGVFTDMADGAKLLEGRLKLVTGSAAELERVQSALADSSKRTRSGYEDTVTLYARVARNADQLGFSQRELLRFTELTQMAIKTSGATAQEASAGVIQLSQALASGTLRGDEFRSVTEQLGGLTRVLVQGMGVEGVGALRKMAFEGKLTAEQVIEAVLKMDASVRGDFAQTPELVAEGWRSLRDEIMLTIGAVDKASSGTSMLAKGFQGLALILQDIRKGHSGGGLEFLPGMGFLGARPERRFGGSTAPSFAAIAPTIAATEAVQDLRTEEEKARDERRKEWEQSRARAAEKKRWDDAEVVRLHEIAAAAHAANVARIGGSLTMGAGSTTVARGAIGSPAMLPAGFGAGSSLTLSPQQMAEAQAKAQIAANEMVAKNFVENMQRSLGTFFSDFLTQGGNAVRSLFSNLSSLGADLAGQALSKALMPKFDSMSPSTSFGIGATLSIVGGLVESFAAMRDAAHAYALAIAESARGLEEFARFATDRALTAEQRGIRDQQDGRDAQARETVAAFGIKGFTGGAGDALDFVEAWVENLEAVGGKLNQGALNDLLAELAELDAAYEANVDVVRELNREMERSAALQRIESLDRTIAGLEGFQTSLGMSNLSTLNPFQQLDLAKTEYNRILQRAMSGDQDAAGQLPAAARAFLEQSRGVNASGARFASDFDRVNADTERALALFEGRRTNEQEMLDTQTGTLEATRAVGTTLIEQNEILRRGMGGMSERLDRVIGRLGDLELVYRQGVEAAA